MEEFMDNSGYQPPRRVYEYPDPDELSRGPYPLDHPVLPSPPTAQGSYEHNYLPQANHNYNEQASYNERANHYEANYQPQANHHEADYQPQANHHEVNEQANNPHSERAPPINQAAVPGPGGFQIPAHADYYSQPAPRSGQPYKAIKVDRRKFRNRIINVPFPPPNNTCHYQGCNASGFEDEVEFQAHIDSHDYELPCLQDRCIPRNAIYPSQKHLNQHGKEQHSDFYSSKTVKWRKFCELCNMDFLSQGDFDKHMRRRHPEAPRAQSGQ